MAERIANAILIAEAPTMLARITALEAEIAGQAWQPVESAPHAMTVIATRFDADFGEWVYAVVLSPPSYPFTHWRLLPAPPLLDQPK